ncbi:MAG: TipAS antibiotic-recognition domain-containing protein [Anaerolineae bacterium]|nr:TipAS antibiotic-recognition domain-containing protein [Anaerolineae bacterium]
MNTYTVRQLAQLAGVSVRTLHHYDQIGLLKPSSRSAAGYRLYGRQDLLRLQQILFFKELDFPLDEIKDILDAPDFDQIKALEQHRQSLQARMERLGRLLNTLDKTIHEITEETMTLTDEELYEGFTPEQRERYDREVAERYAPELVKISQQRLRKLSKAQWEELKAEGGAITSAIAELAGGAPGAPEVQALIARHHAWIEKFYPANAEVYAGLGQLYASHPEFRAFYDKCRPDLADFMCAAMAYYAENVLEK